MARLRYAFLAFSIAASGPSIATSESLTFPEPETRQTFQDWTLECFKTQRSDNDCQAFQRVTMGGGKGTAMVITLTPGQTADTLAIQMALPLGLDISHGALFEFGDDYSSVVPINRCTQQGCLIEGTVGIDLAEKFRTHTSGTVTVIAPGQGNFAIPISLIGLKEALAEIKG